MEIKGNEALIVSMPTDIVSVDESLMNIVEYTDGARYKIKGIDDMLFIEVGHTDNTKSLLLIEETVMKRLLDQINVSGDFDSNIEDQDEWVNQYIDVAIKLYNKLDTLIPHANLTVGVTMGLIRWLSTVIKKNVKIEDMSPPNTRTGGKTRYYNIEPKDDGYVDVDRICDQLQLTFAEGNVLKSLFGIAIDRLTGEPRHTAAGKHIDAEKFKHYSKQVYLKASKTDGH